MDEHPVNNVRMLVLIPDCLAGNLTLARSIYWMAKRNHYDVLYLVTTDNPGIELSVSRRMATMNAFTKDKDVNSAYKVFDAASILRILEANYCKGDILINLQLPDENHKTSETAAITKMIMETYSDALRTLSGSEKITKICRRNSQG